MSLARSTLALLAAASLLAACRGGDEEEAKPLPRAVSAVAVESGPAIAPVIVNGVLAARDESRLAFKIGGVISTIAVRAGESVQQGQLLAEIEATEADAGLAQAQAGRDKAQRDLARGQRLYKDSVITREQFEDLGTAAKIAQAQFDAARYNHGYAQIVAPAEGLVLRRLAEERELVAPGQPVLVLSRANSGHVLRLGLPDREVVRLKLGDPAQVEFDAYPQRRFAAKVAEIGGAADPRTGTFPVELEIDAAGTNLPSGLIGRARIDSSSESQLSYVPLAALIEGEGQRATLFLLDGQIAHQQSVSLAFISGERAALSTTLAAGSRVITEGAAYLRDGETVRVLP